MNGVGRAAEDAGVRLMTDVEVLGFRFDGERASEAATTAGPLGFRELVLATGAWTAKLARALGLRLPIEGGKGYHVDVELAPDALGIPLFIPGAASRRDAT